MEYFKDYYKVLQIDPAADQEIIKVIYKNLVRAYHPDINASADASIRMQEFNEAYAVLGNPQRRAHYDEWFHAQHQSSATPKGSMRVEQTQTIHGQRIHVDVNVDVRPGAAPRPTQTKRPSQSQAPLAQSTAKTWLAKARNIAMIPLILLAG
jgi:DnaJ-class molecular chaperone